MLTQGGLFFVHEYNDRKGFEYKSEYVPLKISEYIQKLTLEPIVSFAAITIEAVWGLVGPEEVMFGCWHGKKTSEVSA